jgi:GxxExxY protein
MKNISSSAKQRDVATKPQNRDMSLSLYRPHHLEKIDPYVRSLWKNGSDGITDFRETDFESSSCHFRDATKILAKQKQEKKKHDVDNKLSVSMRNLSLGITTIPIARAVTKKHKRSANFEITSYVRRNLVEWTEKVFAEVGPGHKEIGYHLVLKNLLLSKGLDIGYEVPMKFERLGSKPIAKRVDLIISMPGVSQKVLIECKAKKKLEKKDYEQVRFYQHHFGIPECYLINFRIGTEVHRLKQRNNA